MSDDRLFASNNAIGRKWYFINILILIIITYITKQVFTQHIIPNVVSDVYEIIAKGILYFAYIIYLITFFALIDRRLYDICGTREKKGYKNTSAILKFAIFCQVLSFYCNWEKPSIPIPFSTIDSINVFSNSISPCGFELNFPPLISVKEL